jgi:hypothetical protein
VKIFLERYRRHTAPGLLETTRKFQAGPIYHGTEGARSILDAETWILASTRMMFLVILEDAVPCRL